MIDVLLIACALLLGAGAGVLAVRARRSHQTPAVHGRSGRILFPFVGAALSERALEACLRLAAAEDATLVPAYLVQIPMTLTLDAPLPRSCDVAFELLEAIEQRAATAGVPVDGRIAPGRTRRHAMRRLMTAERFDRIVVAAGDDGFDVDDVAWLLRHAEGEVLVLRPAAEQPEAAHAITGTSRSLSTSSS
jgi:hypothetical protein